MTLIIPKPGSVAFTIDLDGARLTVCLPARDLTATLNRGRQWFRGWSYEKTVQLFIDFVRAYRIGAPNTECLLPPGLHITMHHPTLGVHVRAAVSQALRRDLPVHIALCITDRNFTVCVCADPIDGRDDLGPLLVINDAAVPAPWELTQ